LKKKIGFGMDERVLNASRQARYVPRKDKKGKPLAGWKDLRFNLQMP
jgi:hypothetical protein